MADLITGGAGFIGCNLAAACIRAGHHVTVFDNLSRRGSDANLAWLRRRLRGRCSTSSGATSANARRSGRPRAGQEAIYHLAAQTAVTTSVTDPRAISRSTRSAPSTCWRRRARPARIRSSSTPPPTRSTAAWRPCRRWSCRRATCCRLPHGVPETRPLDFHSPYGCQQGRGRPVRARLCPHLRPALGRVPPVAASTARARSASRTRAGWPGS